MPKVITPSAGPRVCCGVDVFVTADFIYWTSRMDGLGYATSGVRPTADIDPSKGSVKHPDFGFDPGFKVGLGLNLGHDGWDLFAQYTWLYTSKVSDSASSGVDSLADSQLSPLVYTTGTISSGPSDTVSSARSSFDINLNVIDLELGRNFFVSRYLKIRPHFGLKGAWYDSYNNVNYVGDSTDDVNLNAVSIHQDQDYWGVGIRAGMNTSWHFTRSFSVVGNVILSSLWGEFDVTRKDTEYNTLDAALVNDTYLNTENDFHSMKAVLELFLGLRWDTWFCNDDFHFSIDAGWEEQLWINHNQFFSLYEEGSHGDLYFHGLTLKFRFDF
ncbi:MAG: Lpg1974 family pore-forming outer membrane protein [Simkaniaceae bacterium]